MSVNEKQQEGLVFKDHNGVKLPMTDEDDPNNGAGAALVDIGKIANHPYLENNPYRKLDNDDDDDDDDDNDDDNNNNNDDDIEIVAAPAAIS